LPQDADGLPHRCGGILDEHQAMSADHRVKVTVLGCDLALVKDSGAHLRIGARPPGSHGDHLSGNI
jgi:hypothetical protein